MQSHRSLHSTLFSLLRSLSITDAIKSFYEVLALNPYIILIHDVLAHHIMKIEPFERYAEKYEEWFENNAFVYESELQAVRVLLPKKGIGMEIGIGTGRFAAPLGIKIGIEPANAMRTAAQERKLEVIDGVAEALPFPDEHFDFALKENVFYKSAQFYSVTEVIFYLEKTGFHDLKFTQTVFHRLEQITEVEPVQEGYGKGAFIVVRARKV